MVFHCQQSRDREGGEGREGRDAPLLYDECLPFLPCSSFLVTLNLYLMDKIFWKTKRKENLSSVLPHPISSIIWMRRLLVYVSIPNLARRKPWAYRCNDVAGEFYFLNHSSPKVVWSLSQAWASFWSANSPLQIDWQTLFWTQPGSLSCKESTGVFDTQPNLPSTSLMMFICTVASHWNLPAIFDKSWVLGPLRCDELAQCYDMWLVLRGADVVQPELSTVVVNIKRWEGWDPLLSQDLGCWMRTVMGGRSMGQIHLVLVWPIGQKANRSKGTEGHKGCVRQKVKNKEKWKSESNRLTLMASASPVRSGRSPFSNVWQPRWIHCSWGIVYCM